MKNFFTVLFITLGVIFTIQMLVVAYLVIFDPFNLKPLLFGTGSSFTMPEGNSNGTSNSTSTNKIFLSEAQRKMLASYGIDPASIPTSINAEQEACFKTKLGATRFAQIIAGDTPTAIEMFSAKACI